MKSSHLSGLFLMGHLFTSCFLPWSRTEFFTYNNLLRNQLSLLLFSSPFLPYPPPPPPPPPQKKPKTTPNAVIHFRIFSVDVYDDSCSWSCKVWMKECPLHGLDGPGLVRCCCLPLLCLQCLEQLWRGQVVLQNRI